MTRVSERELPLFRIKDGVDEGYEFAAWQILYEKAVESGQYGRRGPTCRKPARLSAVSVWCD